MAAFCLGQIPMQAQQSDAPAREEVQLKLKRGDFMVFHFPARLSGSDKIPKAVILFGSGGGGWSDWEDRVFHKLQMDGCELIGIDFAIYAGADYNLDTLQSDYQTMAQYCLKPCGEHSPPLIIGGWSTGAEQAVAVAGGPHPPFGIRGLLLVSPGSTVGYGRDAPYFIRIEVDPTRIFNLASFAPKLTNLRVAQWHAGLDPLDSRELLNALKGPHREFVFPGVIHTYGWACDGFLIQLSDSISWILDKKPDASPSRNL